MPESSWQMQGPPHAERTPVRQPSVSSCSPPFFCEFALPFSPDLYNIHEKITWGSCLCEGLQTALPLSTWVSFPPRTSAKRESVQNEASRSTHTHTSTQAHTHK